MKKIKSLVSVLILFFLIAQPLTAFGMGQMIEPIIVENAIQGETIEDTLYIFNTEKEDALFKLTAENDIAGWTKFYDPANLAEAIEEVTIPKNSRYNILVKFEVPKGTPNGVYSGVVGVAIVLGDQEEKEVSSIVSEKVDREVKITVTDIESIDLRTSIIPEKYSLEKGEPLKIRFIYDNQSNINVKPQIQLKLIKDEKTAYNVIYPYPEELESVNSFSMKEIAPLEIQTTGFENGRYSAEITLIVNDNNKFDQHFSFSIGDTFKENLFAGLFGLISWAGGGNNVFGWIIVGSIAVLIVSSIPSIPSFSLLQNNRKTGKKAFQSKKIIKDIN